MTSSLKLEVGKHYRNGLGQIRGPIQHNGSYYIVERGDGEAWNRSGEAASLRVPPLVEEVSTPVEPDPVNQPAHYTQGGVECIEAIKAAMTAEAFAGYLRGNAVKYLWRYEHKGGVESLKKARWYLDRLITETA